MGVSSDWAKQISKMLKAYETMRQRKAECEEKKLNGSDKDSKSNQTKKEFIHA